MPKDLRVQGDLLGVLQVLGVWGDVLGVQGDIHLVPSARGATLPLVFLQIMYCWYLNASMHFHVSLFGGHCRLIYP
jgi:hypothetical protein